MDPLPSEHYGLALFQSLLALAAVCALAWWVLRWAAKRGPLGAHASQGRIKVLDRAMLDGQRSVYLVQVGARVLLLGGGTETVTVLAELSEADLPAVPTPPQGESVLTALSRLRGRTTSGEQ